MRETKDMSLNQVTATTLISERHLKAIEEGNLDLLPEPVYIQGFIRKYSNAVGLNGLAEEFPVNSIPLPKVWATTPAAELRPLHLYALYILVIAGAVGILATFLNPSPQKSNSGVQANVSKSAQLDSKSAKSADIAVPPPRDRITSTPTPLKTTTTPEVQPATSTSTSPTAEAKPSALNPTLVDINRLINRSAFSPSFSFTGDKPVNIGLLMTGESSWVRVIVDDETKFEGMLSEGTRQTWSANRNIVVRAGNAGAVTVTFNQQPPHSLGEEGEVIQQLFDLNYKPTSSPSPNLTSDKNRQGNWVNSAVNNLDFGSKLNRNP